VCGVIICEVLLIILVACIGSRYYCKDAVAHQRYHWEIQAYIAFLFHLLPRHLLEKFTHMVDLYHVNKFKSKKLSSKKKLPLAQRPHIDFLFLLHLLVRGEHLSPFGELPFNFIIGFDDCKLNVYENANKWHMTVPLDRSTITTTELYASTLVDVPSGHIGFGAGKSDIASC
jgi:hypothetical protein